MPLAQASSQVEEIRRQQLAAVTVTGLRNESVRHNFVKKTSILKRKLMRIFMFSFLLSALPLLHAGTLQTSNRIAKSSLREARNEPLQQQLLLLLLLLLGVI